MCKDRLNEEMTDQVVETKRHIRELISRRSRGPGDRENAMRRIEQEFGIGYWTQFHLLYRKVKKIDTELYNRVRQAVLSTITKSVRMDIARLAILAAKANDATDVASLQAEAQDLLARVQDKMEP